MNIGFALFIGLLVALLTNLSAGVMVAALIQVMLLTARQVFRDH